MFQLKNVLIAFALVTISSPVFASQSLPPPKPPRLSAAQIAKQRAAWRFYCSKRPKTGYCKGA